MSKRVSEIWRIEIMSDEKKFDKEYSTSFIKEKQFLDSQGIRYEFVKRVNGITIYKYKKTSTLFKALSNFFE